MQGVNYILGTIKIVGVGNNALSPNNYSLLRKIEKNKYFLKKLVIINESYSVMQK
jgi:hypothetical protein